MVGNRPTKTGITIQRSQAYKKQSELEDLENKPKLTEKNQKSTYEYKDLAKYYELMDGRNAARILENMEDEFLIQIFKQMKNEVVSEILSNLNSQKAASITKKMSGL